MEQRERERWEQFCRTGLISDYLEYRSNGRKNACRKKEDKKKWDSKFLDLEYRSAAGYSRRTPVEGLVPGEEEQDAAWDQGGGALGQKLGGA